MIEVFKDSETRNSGIIYNSTFEQIKKLYEADPEAAGELAIAAIELVLTGDISSEDMMINLLLEPMKKINENNQVKYDNKVENAKTKRMVDMKLDKIAELANAGLKQKEIGEKLGLSQQIVSYRMGLIRTNYPELLQKNSTKIQTDFTNTLQKNKENTKIQKTEQILQTEQINTKKSEENTKIQTVYKNTKDTNFVQTSFCKNNEEASQPIAEPAWKKEFSF